MSAVLLLPPQPLEAPLPAEITGRAHGWLTRYRSYPVFSRRWGLGRVRFFAVALVPVLAMALGATWVAARTDGVAPLGGLFQVLVQLFAPLVIGPALGAWVRRRGLPEPREIRALAAAMAAVVLAVLAFHEWGAEPVKQWCAERAGMVDAAGKRKPLVWAIGISVTNPERERGLLSGGAGATGKPGGTAVPMASETPNHVLNAAVSALITFWLAGGAALWGWRRERDGLRLLARERELAQAQGQRREAELRLSVLAAQVEPHFLFNTLAGVRSAIATDPARASEMIDRLVEYLRAAIPRLRSDGSVQATLGAQLEIVRAYLGLTAARMPRLRFAIDAPADLLPARCPPLMLISLAENAVKHGVERKVGAATVAVRAERIAGPDGDQLAVSVVDDGAGFSAEASGSGLGLANVRERLAQLYPGRAALALKARPEGGVAATLTLPLELPAAAP